MPFLTNRTLYYDTAAGYNRGGSSMHNYETGLRDMGTFTTVKKLFFVYILKVSPICDIFTC